MILDHKGTAISQLRVAMSVPLSTLEFMVGSPIILFDKLSNAFTTHNSLVEENATLKSEQLLLKAQVQRLLSIEAENAQLKALLRSSTEIQGKVLIAQLLAIDSEPFVNEVVLDKGSQQGVYIGQPVLDANGVMGKIIQVGPMTSRLLLITDSHSGVSVQDARSGVRAIAVGNHYDGNLHLVNIPETIDIKAGDIMVTSGLGEHFPAGYPVGTVLSITKDPGQQFANILVQPSAKPDRSRQVLLIWPNHHAPEVKGETKHE
jgi:rod shape-determining protein MreC